jgi:2-keto-4-pentenoate hydratase/2-oxohepta-3-ene-1,7-dioic acid hydratase in catechol pathway
VDAIIGPGEPVIYPQHLTEELDYELELAVVLKEGGQAAVASHRARRRRARP